HERPVLSAVLSAYADEDTVHDADAQASPPGWHRRLGRPGIRHRVVSLDPCCSRVEDAVYDPDAELYTRGQHRRLGRPAVRAGLSCAAAGIQEQYGNRR